MDFLNFASGRYSVRKFLDRPLEQVHIEQLLACAHIAPTGCNYQPQRILVLRSPEAMEKLRGCTKCHFDAPNAMLVCYERSESWVRKYDGALSAPVDAAIVATHIMLMAHSLGIGTCWVMHFDPQAVRKAFAIPETVEPVALLPMGYPHPDRKPAPFHEAVRPMEQTVVYDSFSE